VEDKADETLVGYGDIGSPPQGGSGSPYGFLLHEDNMMTVIKDCNAN
jgi:hypothetical protein